MSSRPVLFVLAGVNGAGKSSIGGYLLEKAGLSWFNPDTFAREWMAATGCEQHAANAVAWQEGMRRFDEVTSKSQNFAFETTLGGRTVVNKILDATGQYDVMVWFCGLASPELHIARVKARVAAGGHAMPEAKIRERYPRALENLLRLMPHLAHLQVYDNGIEAPIAGAVPDPKLVFEMERGLLTKPTPADLKALQQTPDWAKPLLEAALP